MLGHVIEVTYLMAVGASIAVEVIVVMTFLGYPS
jgi:hypothetical protein